MDKLELIVFNVGHGLSVALIERPENYVTLIDLGRDADFTPLKHLSLKMELRSDLLCITHPHADHLDDVETALSKDFAPLGLLYQDYDWEEVKKKEKRELVFKIDKFKDLIRAVPRRSYQGKATLQDWSFSPPNAKKIFGEASYVNNSSLFIVYTWREFKIAIAGDLETDAMKALLDSEEFRADAKGTYILIPALHGHKNGFPYNWVEELGKPHVSIISVQQRDTSVDSRYASSNFARGVTSGGETRYALTTRTDGSIHVTTYYGNDGRAKWTFASF